MAVLEQGSVFAFNLGRVIASSGGYRHTPRDLFPPTAVVIARFTVHNVLRSFR